MRGFATRTGRGDVGAGESDLDETQFHAQAEKILNCLADTLEAAELDSIDDIGFEDGVLSVKLSDNSAFVINKHAPTKQIWYASPISGALYFSPSAPSWTWNCAPRGDSSTELVDVLREDLRRCCPEEELPDFVECQGAE